MVRMGSTNLIHRVGYLPETNEPLLLRASVALESPEHVRPMSGELPRAASGAALVLGPGIPGGAGACVYEVRSDVQTYDPLLALVTLRIRADWTRATYYWCNRDSLAPVYLALEYGVRNTGVFLFLRDDGAGGSLVIGGPLQSYSSERPGQVEIPFPWVARVDVTIGLYINPETQTLHVWGNDLSQVWQIPLGAFGEFQPSTSSFSQRRDGPSTSATLYFGNGGGADDTVEITNYALYRNFAVAVEGAYARPSHRIMQRPDLPYTFFSQDNVLPTDVRLARWKKESSPSVSFWFQPGRKSVPLYAEISQPASGPGFLRRFEPRLKERVDGFSVEAWMAGEIQQLSDIDAGFGIRVGDGQKLYQVSALDTDLVKTYGIFKDSTYEGEPLGYHIPLEADGETTKPADYTSLKLVRLTVDRRRGQLLLFVEDPNVPFWSMPLPATLPPSTVEPFIDIGVISDTQYPAKLKLASASYLNRYLAWEAVDGLPSAAPVLFQYRLAGSGTVTDEATFLRIDKLSYGAGINNHVYFERAGDFTYLRGFQVDFRARLSLYADKTGTSNTPNLWTGAGVTVFLGPSESPNAQCYKIHVGFFDCGAYGRKVAIVPENGYDDILKQTERGRKYSTDLSWMRPFDGIDSVQNLRLVYRPFHAVELWGQGLLKDTPLISIPWDEFEAELDHADTTSGIAFGNFASEVSCVSEWQYLRWGVSSGYEVEVSQDVADPGMVLGGSTLLLVDIEEEP